MVLRGLKVVVQVVSVVAACVDISATHNANNALSSVILWPVTRGGEDSTATSLRSLATMYCSLITT